MKIIAIDNNYDSSIEHAAAPAWYLLTHSCLQRDNKPLYVPDWDSDFRLFPSMAIRVDRLGKSIAERFACRYWDSWSFGFSLRGMETLHSLHQQSLPIGAAVAFDCSAIIAPDWHKAERDSLADLSFAVTDGAVELARWNYADLRLGVDALIEHLSRRMTFKTGDILYLGFPGEGIPVDHDMKIIVNKSLKSNPDTISEAISGFRIRVCPKSDSHNDYLHHDNI